MSENQKSQFELFRLAVEGPHELDLRYLPIFAALSFPLAVLLDFERVRTNYADWIQAKLLGYVVLITFYYVMRYIWLKIGSPHFSFYLLAMISGIGGFLQGVTVSLLLLHFSIVETMHPWIRPVTGFVIGISWLPVNALVTASLVSFEENREFLNKRVDLLLENRVLQSNLAQKIRVEIEGSITRDLKWSNLSMRKKFDDSIVSSQDNKMSANLLRNYAQGSIRELSHNLWHSSTKSEPVTQGNTGTDRKLFEHYLLSARLVPLNKGLYTGVVATLFVPVILRSPHFGKSLAIAIAFTGALLLAQIIADLIFRSKIRSSMSILMFRMIFIVSFTLLITTIANSMIHYRTPNLVFFPGFFIWAFMMGVAFVLSFTKFALSTQDEVLSGLATQYRKDKAALNIANLEIARVSRTWAKHIHGTMQSRLIAVSNLLEQSATSSNLQERHQAIIAAQNILDEKIELEEVRDRDLQGEIEYRYKLWEGILDFTVDCSVRTDLPTVDIAKVGQVMEEVIVNALHHGDASNIAMTFHLVGENQLECTFIDDGKGVSQNSHRGMGSALFDEISTGNWSRSTGPDSTGTRVQLYIPL